MKANKRLAGRSCPICSAPIQMGDPVHNCPNCRQPSHQECWNKNNGCGSGPCQASAPSLLPSLPHQPAPPRALADHHALPPLGDEPPQPGTNLVPCRFCKEPIIRGARKCKHCSEFQRDEDREAAEQSKVAAQGGTGSVSTVDWILIVICPGLTCLGGIIRMCLGYPEAGRVVGYSLVSIFFWAIIRALSGH